MLTFLLQLFRTVLVGPIVVSCGADLDEPGLYVLQEDCSGRGDWVLNVSANNVSLNLAGRKIECRPDSKTIGIKATYAQDMRVSNGRIAGCHTGLHASHAQRVTIRDVQFTGQSYAGVILGGSDHQVLDSRFERIGSDQSDALAFGVVGPGARSVVAGNTFEEIGGAQAVTGTAILVTAETTGALLSNNSIAIDKAGANDVAISVTPGAVVVMNANRIQGYPKDAVSQPGAYIHSIPTQPTSAQNK